jgi:hypothetical protein
MPCAEQPFFVRTTGTGTVKRLICQEFEIVQDPIASLIPALLLKKNSSQEEEA